MPGTAPPTTAPARVLGPVDSSCVVVGAIIGVGIFFTPSGVANLAGTSGLMLAAWALGGAIALCGALTFAELGAKYHASGAQYEVLRDAYGPGVGFCFVLCNATAIQAGAIGVIAMVCVRNVSIAAAASPPAGWELAGLATLLTAAVTAANIAGVRWGSRIQNLTVYAKVLTILAITALAVFAVPARHALPAAEVPNGRAIWGVLAALVPAFFAYGGWQHALWISGEVCDPSRNLPRAIIAGTVLVVIVYLLANVSYLRLLGIDGVKASGAVAADAVGTVLPGAGRRILAGAVAVSAFGVLNAQLLSGPRLLYGMANDGRFFAPFGRLNPRFGTPAASILLLSVMAAVLLAGSTLALEFGVGKESIDLLLAGAVSIDGVFFALTGAALVVLRRKGLMDAPGGFRAPAYPAIPMLFVLGALGIIVGAFLADATRSAAIVGMGWIFASVVIYAATIGRRAPASTPQ